VNPPIMVEALEELYTASAAATYISETPLLFLTFTSLICCTPGTTMAVKSPEVGFKDPLTVPEAIAASKMSPSAILIMTDGIVIAALVPPIGTGSPGTLFITMAPIAPAFCAFKTLSTKAQSPLLITAIFPAALGPKELQANVGTPDGSFAKIKSAVIVEVISDPKFVVG